MVKRQWIKRYTELPADQTGAMIIQSWDTASKGGPDNDWSVCTTWLWLENSQWYLLDVWRGRVDYPGLKAKAIELSHQWGAHQVLIEGAGTSIGLLAELKHEIAGLTGIKPDKDKQTRMSIASAAFEAGEVYFPEQARWLAEHAVRCEPVSTAKSLLTGKITGNFVDFACLVRFWEPIRVKIQ